MQIVLDWLVENHKQQLCNAQNHSLIAKVERLCLIIEHLALGIDHTIQPKESCFLFLTLKWLVFKRKSIFETTAEFSMWERSFSITREQEVSLTKTLSAFINDKVRD